MGKGVFPLNAKMSENQSDDIVSTFRSWCENSQYTDFYFVTKDNSKKFHAHKLVLAMQSPVLSDIVYKSGGKYIKIELSDENAIQNLIRFCYDGEVILDDLSGIKKTKAVSEKYEVFKLSEICKEKFCGILVNSTNVFDVLEMSKDFESEEKEKECLKFMSENLEMETISKQFIHLPFETFLIILEKIKNMNLISESKYLHFIVKWFVTNDPKNETYKKLVMKKLAHLTEIPVDDYFDVIQFYNGSSLEENLIFNLIKKFHGAVVFEKEENKKHDEEMWGILDKQKKYIEEMRQKSDQQEKHIEEMQHKLNQQDKNFQERQRKLNDQEKNIGQMQHELVQQEKKIEERKQKLDQQEKNMESMQNKLCFLEKHIREMQLKFDKQEKYDKDRKCISDKQEKHIGEMQVKLSQHEKLAEERKLKMDQQEEYLKQMQHELNQQKKHIGEMLRKLDQQDKQSNERQRKLDEQEKHIVQMQCKLEEQVKNIEEKKKKLDYQEKLIGEMQLKMGREEKHIEEMQCKLIQQEKNVEERKQQLDHQKKVIEDMQLKLSEQEKYNEDRKRYSVDQAKRIGELERKFDQQKKSNATIQNSIKNCNNKNRTTTISCRKETPKYSSNWSSSRDWWGS